MDTAEIAVYAHRSRATVTRARESGALASGPVPGGRAKRMSRRSDVDAWIARGAAAHVVLVAIVSVLVLVALLLAVEVVDLAMPGRDLGFPPGLGHPLPDLLNSQVTE